ncbi:MAG: cell division transport system ATP-binding protein [Bacteroidales bacterium]|jgi:cell division transport system ATP-binding protein|nr:cell division transport system ATP-binding protein [Bacteroidales bacterium]MDN5329189.1 cell division transport system ATP-binding protein [Bacteroidales bacterium]
MSAVVDLLDVSVFHKDVLVLSGITLKVEPGELVYLTGKTGSGKSSLLRTLYADLPLKAGQAKVVGYDLNRLRKKDIPYLRRKIGIVFQDFQLLSDRSVEDNLLFVMKATGWKDKVKMKMRVEELLNLTGLETKGHKMPHQLSGGEQQRVGVARALINQPELIIADEPTGNLDPESSEGILGLLRDISRLGTAIIVATHNYRMISLFPGTIYYLSQGKVIHSEISDSSFE